MFLFQNIVFLKKVFASNAVLGYLAKLKRGLELALGGYFLLFNTLSMDKVSISYLFSSQNVKQNVSLSSYLCISRERKTN